MGTTSAHPSTPPAVQAALSTARRRPPPWSPFPAGPALATFLTSAVAAARVLGPVTAADLEAGVLSVHTPHGPVELNLRNLAERCAASPRCRWRRTCDELIAVAARSDPVAIRRLGGDLRRCLPGLHLRLWPDQRTASLGGQAASFECLGGLGAMLVHHLDDALAAVPVEDRDRWDVSDDELFAVAAAQTVACAGRSATVSRHLSTGLVVVTGASALVAGLALRPERLYLGGHGVLLGLASASQFVVVPLAPANDASGLVPAIGLAVPLAAEIHRAAPDPLTSRWLSHDLERGFRMLPPEALAEGVGTDAWR
jgi:hypothetical protein